MLDQLFDEFSHMRLVVLGLLLHWLILKHLLFDFILVKWHEFESEKFVDESGKLIFLLEFSGVFVLEMMKKVYFLVVIWTNEQINGEVLEGLTLKFSSQIEFLGELFICLVDLVVNDLVCFGSLENHLLMNIVANHKLVEFNLELLETRSVQMSLRDLLTKDLASYEVSPHEDELHLIKDEFDFLLNFKGTVCFNLNFLNDFSGLFRFAVFLEILTKCHGRLGIFTLEEHLTFTSFSQ